MSETGETGSGHTTHTHTSPRHPLGLDLCCITAGGPQCEHMNEGGLARGRFGGHSEQLNIGQTPLFAVARSR